MHASRDPGKLAPLRNQTQSLMLRAGKELLIVLGAEGRRWSRVGLIHYRFQAWPLLSAKIRDLVREGCRLPLIPTERKSSLQPLLLELLVLRNGLFTSSWHRILQKEVGDPIPAST